MVKQLRRTGFWVAIATASALTLGATAAFLDTTLRSPSLDSETDSGNEATLPTAAPALQANQQDIDPVFALANQPPEQRSESLSQLSTKQNSQGSPQSRNRARYLLAVDYINRDQGGSAIPLLQGLASDYPEMAPMILLYLAQAQTAAGQSDAAQTTLEKLLSRHGSDPAAAEALYRLGQQNQQRLDQLIKEFPSHPRSVEVALERLEADPYRADALPLLLIVAQHGLHHPRAGAVLQRLKTEFADQLQPEHWQAIGFGYWKLDDYPSAGAAYARAPASPRNLYRAARGMQIGGRRDAAIATFTRLDQQFPEADETAQGLLRLSESLPDQAALSVLEQVVNRFPDRAAEALAKQAQRLEAANSPESAQAIRQLILERYKSSEAAAELRIEKALAAAETGDLAAALDWAQAIMQDSAHTSPAAEAGFWIGKWGRQLGQADIAQQSLEKVIAHHPESYYAWRAAVALGWNVGDFKTVRFETPQVQLPAQRETLPAGSDILSELYQLGQLEDAWSRWQVEFSNSQDPTVAEQFTDGLMRLGMGDNLDGIYAVSSLSWRERPQDQTQYQQLKRKQDYWQALYPFPYGPTVQAWAQKRQLNPLLVMALIRQESRFESDIRSSAGAMGLMQVMPATAAWIQPQANIASYDLKDPQDNITLGTWYLAYTHQEYANHSLFAVASYNAGPGNVAKWINRGYTDEDEFVEKIPFPETKNYVRAVFGGYWNYLRLYNPTVAMKVNEYQNRILR